MSKFEESTQDKTVNPSKENLSEENTKKEVVDSFAQQVHAHYGKAKEIMLGSINSGGDTVIDDLVINKEEAQALLALLESDELYFISNSEKEINKASGEKLNDGVLELKSMAANFSTDEALIKSKIKNEIVSKRSLKEIKESQVEMGELVTNVIKKISNKQNEFFQNEKINEAVMLKDVWKDFDLFKMKIDSLETGSNITGTLNESRASAVENIKQDLTIKIDLANQVIEKIQSNMSNEDFNQEMENLGLIASEIMEILDKTKL